MSTALNRRAIFFGSLVAIGGYFLCVLCVGALVSIDAPRWLWLALVVLAISIAAFSGFVGAIFAPAKPLIHGTLSGLAGALVLLSLSALVVPLIGAHVGPEYASPFLIIVALAFGGAFVAVFIWPRRGL
jgi:hypothetical protein